MGLEGGLGEIEAMCVNFATPYRARRGAVKFRREYDPGRRYQYVLTPGKLISTGQVVWHVAVYSAAHYFLTYV